MTLAIRKPDARHVIQAHDPDKDLEEMKKRRVDEFIKVLRKNCRGFQWELRYGDMCKLSSIGNKFSVYRTTYKTRDTSKIALKIKKCKDNPQLHAFVQEALILREVVHDHPNVITLLGVCIDKVNTLFIELEFHPGTVGAILEKQKGPATLRQIQTICRDTLKALYFCHKHRVLHADIKEPNLLTAADGRIVLADFDSSVVIPKPPMYFRSYDINPLGTRPLEVCLKQPLTFTPDIWALGCMIVRMCRPPRAIFTGATPQDQLNIIHSFAGPIPESLFVNNASPKLVNPTGPVKPFEQVFDFVPCELLPFLKRLFTLNQYHRPKAIVALNDPFFFFNFDDQDPLPRTAQELEPVKRRKVARDF